MPRSAPSYTISGSGIASATSSSRARSRSASGERVVQLLARLLERLPRADAVLVGLAARGEDPCRLVARRLARRTRKTTAGEPSEKAMMRTTSE